MQNLRMKTMPNLQGLDLQANSLRLAFADPEFMLRPEARGIRLQMELLKPDLVQSEAGIEQTVVVFGSARFLSKEAAQAQLEAAQQSEDAAQIRRAQTALGNAAYYEAARQFAGLVAQACAHRPVQERLTICTGGGPGIMEAANRGAKEAGADSVALNIALPHEQQPNPYVTEGLSFKFHYFAIRKMHFMMRAKALVAFPGGFGTLDELFEILTLVQTHKTHKVPILLFGSDYWKPLINFDHMIEHQTISSEDVSCFHFVDTPQDAWQRVKSFYGM